MKKSIDVIDKKNIQKEKLTNQVFCTLKVMCLVTRKKNHIQGFVQKYTIKDI